MPPCLAYPFAILSQLPLAALNQSAVEPATTQAARIAGLWWIYLIVLSCVWAVVIAFLLRGSFKARPGLRAKDAAPLAAPVKSAERGLTNAVIAALSVTLLILLGLLIIDFYNSRALATPAPADALKVKITGHQWWWEIQFHSETPSEIITTANELHLPVGKPVRFDLQSVDVIHSFWLPNLHGKRDLIPGHPATIWFTPTRTGNYFGQCAEFCGAQHAHMRLAIVVEPVEQFEHWLQAQRQSAPPPATPQQQRGQQVFLSTTCVLCHNIQGTPAHGIVGPDLTHVASRQWIGAGALPNVRGYLAGWILNASNHKPGVLMPPNTFAGEDLNALLDYLQTLQ